MSHGDWGWGEEAGSRKMHTWGSSQVSEGRFKSLQEDHIAEDSSVPVKGAERVLWTVWRWAVSLPGGGRPPHSRLRENNSQVNLEIGRWPFSDVPSM